MGENKRRYNGIGLQLGFDRFHNDLLAALQNGVPLEIGEASIVRLSKSKLNQLKQSAVGRFGDSLNPDSLNPDSLQQMNDDSSGLPKRYLAGLRTFAQTDSMAPVLDGFTTRVDSRRKAARVFGRVLLYLFWLMAAALGGLLIFSAYVTPVIDEVRTNIFLHRDAPDGFDFIAWLPAAIVTVAVMLLLMLLWMIFGGTSRTAMWFGGRQYVRCLGSATALRILQLLVEKGMPLSDGIEVSCDLAGVDRIGRREIASAIRGQKTDESEFKQSLDTQTDLRSMANYMTVLAEHRLEKMRFSVPVLLVCLFGGTLSLVYCLAVFSPIVDLLCDLNYVGTH